MKNFHIVRDRDTLSNIAKQYGTNVTDLRRLNELPNPNKLHIGQRIALRKEAVCGFEILFIDADRNPINKLEYVLEFNDKSIKGITGKDGKTKKVTTDWPTDLVRVLVKRFDGTYKKVTSLISGYRNKQCTLVSPLLVIDTQLKPYPKQKPDERLNPKEPIKPAYGPHNPATPTNDKKELGPQTKQTATPNGKALTIVEGDVLELDFLAPAPDPTPLSDTDFIASANALNVSPAHIKTITEVEARGNFFWKSRKTDRYVPPILFERHKFSKYTDRMYDNKYPDISSRKLGGYVGYFGEYYRLAKAMQLNREAALKSASWGAFQIMGEHHKALGFATAEEFLKFVSHSPNNQLEIFVRACQKVNPIWGKSLRENDWVTFAKTYNGLDYKKNNYDEKLRMTYEKLSKENN